MIPTSLKKVEELDLSDNYLGFLPRLTNFGTLRVLNLQHANLYTLGGIELLTTLKKLDISHNKELKNLPSGFSKLTQLKELVIIGNPWLKNKTILGKMPNLKVVTGTDHEE